MNKNLLPTLPTQLLKANCRSLVERYARREIGVSHNPIAFGEWNAYLFDSYPGDETIERLRSVPEHARYYYRHDFHRYRRLSIWCVHCDFIFCLEKNDDRA